VLAELFGSELGRLARRLAALAARHRVGRDLPPSGLRAALVEVTACLPVYRTYLDESGASAADAAWLGEAFAEARARARAGPGLPDPVLPLALDFLETVLHLRLPAELASARPEWLDFVALWQQTSGAVMAKGMEDTVLYVHARLVALNDVGGEPPGVDPPGNAGAFHERNRRRSERWPNALTSTSTHDSKRSEDVAARIDVLSEMPAEWEKRLARWGYANAAIRRTLPDGRVAPDPNEEVFLYQTLIGAWPLADEELPAFPERVAAYLRKALREAKTHSSWLAPDEAYEEAVLGFGADLLRAGEGNAFLPDFVELVERVAVFGAWGSLAQLVLKIAGPGVPDLYQGTELWDLSLVDPDNRRPVDFPLRLELLAELRRRHASGDRAGLLAELLAGWRDGRVKLYTTWRALEARRELREPFLHGDYTPLAPEGARARHLVAFARRHGDRWLLAVVPRWLSGLVGVGQPPVGGSVWSDTWLPLPDGAPARWRDTIGGGRVRGNGRLAAGEVLESFPVALLTGE
jgi:(1->4)-alpha-D-glucan 1-alpha-D-glucosylmutase